MISKLTTSLQRERGLSSGYLASPKSSTLEALKKEQKKSDHYISELISTYKHHLFSDALLLLNTLRTSTMERKISLKKEFEAYTKIIHNLYHYYILLLSSIDNLAIAKDFSPYTSLTVVKESCGQIRGTLHAIFTKKSVDREFSYIAIHAKGQYDIASERYITIAPENFKQSFLKIIQSDAFQWITNKVNIYLRHVGQTIDTDPQLWFQHTTYIINEFNKLQTQHLHAVEEDLQTLQGELSLKITFNILALLLFVIILFFLGETIEKSILHNIKILNEYKNAVDRGSIVSKTDVKGKISYVNDKFVQISGYSEKELLGKNHNIVRHPEVDKSVFKDMWQTILAKKTWNGIVKNIRKDGSEYTVEASISPIVNSDGEIEEFIAIRNDISEITKLNQEIEHTQKELILRMGEIGERRSNETGIHVQRVAAYSKLLAQLAGLSEEEVQMLTLASPMHDIGKVAISDEILNKTGKLDDKEWRIMQTHSQVGYELFKDSHRPLLKAAAIIAHEHHEKYNGTGYPRGIKEEDIHIFGRITALVDVFDALGSDRCYKKAWDDAKIFKLLKEEKGEHFDPQLIDLFFSHLDAFLSIRDRYKYQSGFMSD